jgi:hypothetical protein
MNEEIINIDTCGDNIQIELGGSASTVISVNGRYGYVSLDKTDVQLDQVDNTSDLNKPLSNATIFALMSSVNWNQVFNFVQYTSTTWINQTVVDYTHSNFLPLSGNSTVFGNVSTRSDFYTWGNIVSGGRALVDLLATFGSDELARTLLMNGSANWDNTFNNVTNLSGGWQKAADEITKYLPLSGGDVTGMISASGVKIGSFITYTDKYIVDKTEQLVREVYVSESLVGVLISGNIPRYLPMYIVDYLVPWEDENGNIFVTNENGDVLMF